MGEQIGKWEEHGNRAAVTQKQRVKVRPFKGSLLWSHMLNVQTMLQRWNKGSEGGECAFFLYQASNMMWVRKGSEAEVRSRRYAQVRSIKPKGCSAGLPITKEVFGTKHAYGWGQPEGSFYPMSMMRKFHKQLRNIEDISNFMCNTACY